MIPDSTNGTREYFEDQPDWAAPYRFDLECQTTITMSKNGAEQRAKGRVKPRYRIAYQLRGMRRAEASIMKARMMLMLARPVSVPLWHVQETIAVVLGDQISLVGGGLAIARSPFKPGGLAYFTHATLGNVFRRIVSVQGNTVMNLLAGNCEFPNVAFPAYGAGTRVYPVIDGQFDANTTRFVSVDKDTTSQAVEIYEL